MKKKLVSLVLVVALAATLAACAKQTPAEPKPVENQPEVVGEVTEEKTEAVEEKTEEQQEVKEEITLETAEVGEVVDGIVKVKERTPVDLPDNDGINFVRDMEIGWNLGNAFDANDCTWLSNELDYESGWCGAKTTKELISALKDAGYKTIRIPVSWHNHVDADYNISEAWLGRVQEVVDWAYDEGMYVIINIHHDNNENFEYPNYDKLDQSKKYVSKIWEQLADRFADYDEHLIFETMNEPRLVGTDVEWWIQTDSEIGKEALDCVNQLNQIAVDTIRANGKGYNTSRYIMAPGYCASPEFALADAYKVPDDSKATAENRIIVSIHAYTPYNFALNQDAGQTKTFSIKNGDGADIESFLSRIYDKFVSKGIPVVIGEFGALDKDNLEARREFTAYYIYSARHYGMTALVWDNNALNSNGENFKLIDRASATWVFPEIVDQMMYYCK